MLVEHYSCICNCSLLASKRSNKDVRKLPKSLCWLLKLPEQVVLMLKETLKSKKPMRALQMTWTRINLKAPLTKEVKAKKKQNSKHKKKRKRRSLTQRIHSMA